MHGQFARDMEDKDMNNTRRWMRKSDLKGCAEALICSTQEQSIQPNYIKYNIDKTVESPICRMCRTRIATISHIVSDNNNNNKNNNNNNNNIDNSNIDNNNSDNNNSEIL